MYDLDPDRLFPAEDRTRGIARELFALVEHAPIISPHGHVDPRILVDDVAYSDPATLLVSSDHYVTRMLHAAGIPLDELGGGTDPRDIWQRFCDHWHWFAGSASGGWLRETFGTIFGMGAPTPAMFDELTAELATNRLRPRELFRSFGLEVLATTDDPLDDLSDHAALRADPSFGGRVVPTFRPDAYLDPTTPGWLDRVDRLGGDSYPAFVATLETRRAYFIEHGAVSADHGVEQPLALELSTREAATLFDRARAGRLSNTDAAHFRAHMLMESARMSVADGLVMTVHAGILRGHHRPTLERFGPDRGHDIPIPTTFTQAIRPLLERFGTAPGFHLVLFALDESVWSRELAPLAGFYPSVFIGAPWWFLDAPDAMRRFRDATTETAGFYSGSGFIDDTRAFMSIAARHSTARRVDSGYLARLVVEGRLTIGEAERIAVDLVDAIPRRAFKL